MGWHFGPPVSAWRATGRLACSSHPLLDSVVVSTRHSFNPKSGSSPPSLRRRSSATPLETERGPSRGSWSGSADRRPGWSHRSRRRRVPPPSPREPLTRERRQTAADTRKTGVRLCLGPKALGHIGGGLAIGNGVGCVGEGAALFHLIGGAEEGAEGNAGQRPADADPLHPNRS